MNNIENNKDNYLHNKQVYLNLNTFDHNKLYESDESYEICEMLGGGRGEKDKEIEWRFINIDANKIRKKLKEVGAELVRAKMIMPLIAFTHPQNKKDSYIRIRDEGDHVTMTSKTDLKHKFVTEYEVVIDNFAQGVKILKSLGCKKRYYVEKLRETWKLPGAKEIVIDSYPGTSEYLEIECETEKDLIRIANLLGLKNHLERGHDIYNEEYGIPKDRKISGDLTFSNAYKIFGKQIKKNKSKFKKILKEQQKYYKKSTFKMDEIDD